MNRSGTRLTVFGIYVWMIGWIDTLGALWTWLALRADAST